jgi:diaminopimelate decarboxylase
VDYFIRKRGELYCEAIPLRRLADKYGTPLYVYSLRTFARHFKVAERAFGDIPHAVFYSAKANSNLTLLNVIARLGGGCDVVSLGEYLSAKKAGIRRIIFSGVAKQVHEIERALIGGLDFFGVESEAELELIEKIAAKLGKIAPISLRVNPDVDPRTHPHIATGLKKEKFGIPASKAVALYRSISENRRLKAEGISMHLGSQIQSVKPFVEGLARLKKIVGILAEQKIVFKHIDIGGGWAVPFARDQKLPGPSDYIRALIPQMGGMNCEFIIEPGRSLIGNAGVLLSRVVYIKSGQGKKFVIVDAGMNDFIRTALYGKYHRLEPVSDRGGKSVRVDVVGPVCESSDAFGRKILLSMPRPGDYLCLFTAGAYGYSMASNYNSRLRPAEVLIDGSKDYLIRQREDYNDLWKKQKLIKLESAPRLKI